jgi:hypothetical protein
VHCYVQNEHHTGEFKQMVAEDMKEHNLSQSETATKYEIACGPVQQRERQPVLKVKFHKKTLHAILANKGSLVLDALQETTIMGRKSRPGLPASTRKSPCGR